MAYIGLKSRWTVDRLRSADTWPTVDRIIVSDVCGPDLTRISGIGNEPDATSRIRTGVDPSSASPLVSSANGMVLILSKTEAMCIDSYGLQSLGGMLSA